MVDQASSSQPAVPQNGPASQNQQQTVPQTTQNNQQMLEQSQQVAAQVGQAFTQVAQMATAAPAGPQPSVTQEEKVWAALSYIPMVALVAFLIKPTSEFVKLHGKQGLLIFIIFFFSIFLYIILPPLGPLLGGLIQLAMFVIGIFSIYQALMGNWWKTPVLGQIADIIPVSALTNVATQAITGQEPAQSQTMEVPPMEQSAQDQTVQQDMNQQNPPQNPPAGSHPQA